MMSAGEVFVLLARSVAPLPVVSFLKRDVPAEMTPDMSPLKYDIPAPNNPCPASASKFGSFNVPCDP